MHRLADVIVDYESTLIGSYTFGGIAIGVGVFSLIFLLVYSVEGYPSRTKVVTQIISGIVGVAMTLTGSFLNASNHGIQAGTEEKVRHAIEDNFEDTYIISSSLLFSAIKNNGIAKLDYISDGIQYSENIQVVSRVDKKDDGTTRYESNFFIIEKIDEDSDEDNEYKRTERFTPCTEKTCEADGTRKFN